MPAPISENYLKIFNELWNDKAKMQDVTEEVIRNITEVYKENSPEFIYYVTLYNIFNEFLQDISEAVNPQTMDEHAVVAQQGGEVARNARLDLEQKTGQKVVTSLNAKSIHQIDKHKGEE
ncbi:hypothetical protein [Bacteroides sp.]|uniref:hypothetical protein n=1 Tax=Bacteroides sp. TaxID=29523 RepID=UPI0026215D6F|nr:hypothetical protein [Bacteroides sp.]MDD3038726.1 hypothetical protein [Bacteroides sp.]